MSDRARTPGRIDEDATPVDGFRSSDGEPLGIENRTGITTENRRVNREPGPVDDLSETMLDDEKDARSAEIVDPETIKHGPWGIVFLLFSISVFSWLSYESVLGIIAAWKNSMWLGVPFVVLVCVFLVVFGWASRREYIAFKAIDGLEDRRYKMRIAVDSNNLTELHDALKPTLDNLRKRHAGLIEEFEEGAKARETAAAYLGLYENLVLTRLDEEANAVIQRSALGGGTVIAIIPHPALDAVIALWRSMVLVRKIGDIYGLEPTGLSSLRLLKRSIATAIIAAGTSIAIDLIVADVIKDGVEKTLSKIGGAVTEGAVTAYRLYRLGKFTQNLCRPTTNL